MNVAFFMGAGFSAPFGLPTMDQFLAVADASRRITKEDRELLGILVLEARRANSFLQSSPTNLEDILSFAVMAERLALSPAESGRSSAILRILHRIYTQVRDSDTFWGQFTTFHAFLGDHDLSRNQYSFITTNYDLNLECSIHSMGGRSVDPGFTFKQPESSLSTRGHLYGQKGIPVHKLHGSVNWLPCPEEPSTLLAEDRLIEVMGGPRSGSHINSLPMVCHEGYKLPTDPVIVPPSFLKPEFSHPIRQIWTKAAASLSEASILVFVGYSFPPTDTEMRYFLARSLMENSGIRRILVVDPRAGAIVERLRANAAGFGSHFRDLLEPVESDWTKAKVARWWLGR